METNNNPQENYGYYKIIARACNCSTSLVRAVVKGGRRPVTGREGKTALVVKKIQEFDKFYASWVK